MSNYMTIMRRVFAIFVCCGMATAVSCKPSDVLSVPDPAGVVSSTALNSPVSAQGAFYAARSSLFSAIAEGNISGGMIQMVGLLTDEFTWSAFHSYAFSANVDARMTAGNGGEFGEPGNNALIGLLAARSDLLVANMPLQKYEMGAAQSMVGETYALIGYAELFMAEDYCAGVPLSQDVPGGGVAYGTPLTRDSLLGTAEAHFESALAYASGNDTVIGLARVGLGRTLLDRGQFAQADTAVASVPTNFVYNTVLSTPATVGTTGIPSNLYEWAFPGVYYGCSVFNVADQEGGNGLNFVSANDPRLTFDITVDKTCDGQSGLPDSVWYYPTKFGEPSTYIPLATGIEARLIQAEADLQGSDGVAAWANDLNNLRADSADTKVAFASLLPADSTTGASSAEQVDVMFRERAFWLFGTGTRLGDLRRLLLPPYNRDPSTVYPTGAYAPGNNPVLATYLPTPLLSYGSDVDLTLPTAGGFETTPNPNYKGCLTGTTTP